MGENPKVFVYTFLFKNGTKKRVKMTKEAMQKAFKNERNVSFVVQESNTDRYIFKNGMWTIKK